MDIPAGSGITASVFFPSPGIYEFYCNRPFHKVLGMKGQVQAIKRQ